MSDLCLICRGAGNIVTFSGGLTYWPCHYCGGAGVSVQHGPAAFTRRPRPTPTPESSHG